MSQYDQWRSTLNDQSSEDDLAQALIGLLTPIDDSHVIAVPALSKAARDRNEDSALNAAFDVLALPNPVSQ